MNQKGSISTGAMIAIGAVASIILVAAVLVIYVIGVNNYAVKAETAIEAQYKDNQNILSNYGKKVAETAQVPAMYRDDFGKVVSEAISARYGESGSKAAFQWLQEAKIDYDASIYKQIQQVIESGRNEFAVGQRTLLDRKRVYEAELGTFPKGLILGLLGFPKKDLSKMDIVTDARTEQAFETKKEEAIKLR